VLLVHGNGQRRVDASPPPLLLLLGDEDGDPELLLLGQRWRGRRLLAALRRVEDAVGDAPDEVVVVVPGLLARDVVAAHLLLDLRRRLLRVLLHLLDEGLRLRRL
jgi:hypothetical protein